MTARLALLGVVLCSIGCLRPQAEMSVSTRDAGSSGADAGTVVVDAGFDFVRGIATPACAPNDGSATVLRIGVVDTCTSGTIDQTELALLLWGEPVVSGADFEANGVEVSRCDGEGKCVQGTATLVHLDIVDDAHIEGDYRITISGQAETAHFSVPRCPTKEPIRCG